MFTPLNKGTILQNRYEIVGLLGKGGMGAVYQARHLRLRTEVAIKQTILAGEDDFTTAFEREAALLANLSHESLPRVLDFFSENEGHFIVMELIDGEDLSERLKNRQRNGFRCMPLSEVLDATNQLLTVLDYLHDKQIVHKDIKPANLKITTNGKLKLLDFGLAKGHAGLMTKHLSSFLKGATPDYAPPEQLRGESTVPQSDLFSVGATMYHLLSGKIPLDPLSQRALKMADGEPDPLPSLNDVNAEVSQDIAKVFHKAMALNPNKRYLSAKDMQTALQNAVLPETKPAPNVSDIPPNHKPSPKPFGVKSNEPPFLFHPLNELLPKETKTAVGLSSKVISAICYTPSFLLFLGNEELRSLAHYLRDFTGTSLTSLPFFVALLVTPIFIVIYPFGLLFAKKRSAFIRFHAIQSLLLFVIFIFISIVTFIFYGFELITLLAAIAPLSFGLAAIRGETLKVPLLGYIETYFIADKALQKNNKSKTNIRR